MFSQFVKFIGVGGINTLFTYILYLFLLYLFDYQISYTIAYISGIILSYILNLKFVFQEKSTKTKLLLFPLVYLVQYTLGIILLYLMVDLYAIPVTIAPVLVVIITTPLVFFLNKVILTAKRRRG